MHFKCSLRVSPRVSLNYVFLIPTHRNEDSASIRSTLGDRGPSSVACRLGRILNPFALQTGMEPGWTQDGTRMEPGWNQDGTRMKPGWNPNPHPHETASQIPADKIGLGACLGLQWPAVACSQHCQHCQQNPTLGTAVGGVAEDRGGSRRQGSSSSIRPSTWAAWAAELKFSTRRRGRG